MALYSKPLKVDNNVTVDVDPPEFVSLASDKTEVRSGERVNYTLKAKDNGKLTTASIVLKNDANGKTKSLYADAPTTDGTYSFTLEVDEKLSSGIWRLNEITLRDDSDNYVDIYGEDALALYSKPLKVGESSLNNVSNNLQPDTEAPKLISIKLNQTSATEHDVVTYTVDASDNRQLDSAYLTIRSVSSPSKYEILTGKLNKEGQLIFRYQVDENSFPGDWEISRLAIYDKAKNISEYNSENLPKESSPLLTISNNLQPDTEAPKLISIKLNQTSATEHDVVTYTVDASDNRQLDSAYLTIRSVSSPSKYEILTGKLNKEGQLIFRYQVDENSFPGDWEISRLAIYDKAKNISEYNSENLPKESSPLLTISNNLQPDTEAPKLISIKLNQTNATEHDVVTYTIDASDNRQLDSAYLTIRPVSSPSKYEILTGKLNKEGQLIFRYQVDENSFPGDWEISRLAIYDKAKNISEYNSENLPKESSPILRVANRREISSLDSINSEKESTLSIHGINNVEKSKNDANILPTDSLSNNQPIDENSTAVKSPDKSDSENSATVQSPDKTSNENINTTQSPDKTDSENSTTVQSPDKIDSENSTAVQSPDKSDSENSATVQSPDKSDSENSATVQSPDKSDSENSATVQSPDKSDSENSATVQSPDKNNSESINMELYVQDELQNNGFSPYGEGNLFENANSDMIEKNNELKINQYPKRIERNLPKTGNKLFSVLSILGAISLLLILLRILMKTL
ncbi:MG2 domain protein [Streptococcus mitis]|nr:MG2 domain protein [Streptococcus mitis]